MLGGTSSNAGCGQEDHLELLAATREPCKFVLPVSVHSSEQLADFPQCILICLELLSRLSSIHVWP